MNKNTDVHREKRIETNAQTHKQNITECENRYRSTTAHRPIRDLALCRTVLFASFLVVVVFCLVFREDKKFYCLFRVHLFGVCTFRVKGLTGTKLST